MVEMALLFVAFTLLVFLLGIAAAAYYVPKALESEETSDSPEQTA